MKVETPADSSLQILPASERLTNFKDEIIRLWEEGVCRAIPAAKELDETQLRNNLPTFLDELSAVLDSQFSNPTSKSNIVDISKVHAYQRAYLGGYFLNDVLKEYQTLQETIFKTLDEPRSLSSKERDTILFAIAEGTRETAVQFMKIADARKDAAEMRYRLVVGAISDYAIIRTDQEGRIVDWNPGAERIFQYEKDEILGKPSELLFTPEDLAKNAVENEMTVAREKGKAEDNRWHLKKDGSRFFANGVMNPLKNEWERQVGYVKVLRDETAKKKAEIVRENFFSLPDLMLGIIGKDGFLKEVNSAWEHTLGWTATELTSRPWIDFVHPDDRERTLSTRQRLAAGEVVVGFQNRIQHKNGRYRWLEWSARQIGDVFYCVSRDITEFKLAQQQIEANNQDREEVISIVSHDLKNPAMAIGLNADWLDRQLGKSGNTEVLETIKRIKTASELMNRLITDILDLSKMSKGTFHIEPKMMTPSELVTPVEKLIRPNAEQKQISFTVELESGCKFMGDPDRMAQVLSNLLTNAIKFTPSQGRVSLSARRLADKVQFQVSDTGIGISAEELEHIFERYWQGLKTSKRGNGLGLYIAKKIVEAHHGELKVKSVVGKGSNFFVNIPCEIN